MPILYGTHVSRYLPLPTPAEEQKLSDALIYRPADAAMNITLYVPGQGLFPTGLLSRVQAIIPAQVVDKLEPIHWQRRILIRMPWPHQQEAFSHLTSVERGAVEMATGSGKSQLAGMLAGACDLPVL